MMPVSPRPSNLSGAQGSEGETFPYVLRENEDWNREFEDGILGKIRILQQP
jgi:hypothetical protein